MNIEMITVTPAMAKVWLEGQPLNRRLNRAVVGKLAGKLRTGRWVVNHEAIALDADGRLLDGQHRLSAVIESGVPMRVLVARGVSEEGRRAADTGRPRNVSDLLRLSGRKYTNYAPTLARHILGGPDPSGAGKRHSNEHIADVAIYHSEEIEALVETLGHFYPASFMAPFLLASMPGSPFIEAEGRFLGDPRALEAAKRLGKMDFRGADDPMRDLAVRYQRDRADGRGAKGSAYRFALAARHICYDLAGSPVGNFVRVSGANEKMELREHLHNVRAFIAQRARSADAQA